MLSRQGVIQRMPSISLPSMPAGYPNAAELERCLLQLAAEVNDPTPRPVFVSMVPVNGGKPPIYAVVLRSRNRENIRQKLSVLLNRQLCLGVSSFCLKTSEAQLVIQYQNRNNDHTSVAQSQLHPNP